MSRLRSQAILGTMAAAMVLSLAVTPISSPAQTPPAEHAHTLHDVMEELGADYLRAANALILEDFKVLEETAGAIHHHPMPKEAMAAIKNKLGKRYGAFQAVDGQVHRAAAELAKRAAAKDIAGAAKAFGAMTNACVSCHRQFRATLKGL
ncbi:MAG: cytochrome c [Hyphomicrobiales bacterium]|nr:cytochrome c [Hyphomicrobiales bacterium]